LDGEYHETQTTGIKTENGQKLREIEHFEVLTTVYA
jgi:hypothetical protein